MGEHCPGIHRSCTRTDRSSHRIGQGYIPGDQVQCLHARYQEDERFFGVGNGNFCHA